MPPRASFTALAAILTLGTFLLFRRLAAPPAFYRDAFGGGGYGLGRSLRAWLREEDARYAEVVRARQQLITKWGPTESQVEPYPTRVEQLYTLWDFFTPAFQCPHRVERVGTMGDGGKWVCGLDRVAKQKRCVIYSFGINGESSFERDLLRRAPGCEAWGYDYSVDGWGPEVSDDPELSNRAHFHAWALGDTDKHEEGDDPKYWTLDSLMKLNGHAFIDVLKIDIEGSEFDSLASFLNSRPDGELPIGQLQLEIHAWGGRERFDYFLKWWEALEAAGLRPFWTEPNLVYVNLYPGSKPGLTEYSFMNIRGNHALVNDAIN